MDINLSMIVVTIGAIALVASICLESKEFLTKTLQLSATVLVILSSAVFGFELGRGRPARFSPEKGTIFKVLEIASLPDGESVAVMQVAKVGLDAETFSVSLATVDEPKYYKVGKLPKSEYVRVEFDSSNVMSFKQYPPKKLFEELETTNALPATNVTQTPK